MGSRTNKAAPQPQTSQVRQADTALRFIDLFAGIGGLRLGFEAIGGKCVFTSEWDEYAQKTYKANFGDDEIFGNIRDVKVDEIPPFDVLLAGFPCQPFSISGVSKRNALGRPHGFDCDTQGTLFFEIEKILKHHKPTAFVLENVKNLLTHDKGNTFRVIHDTLKKKLNYNISYRVIDGQHFVPQHRERIFIVGFREPNGFDLNTLVLPPTEHSPRLKDILHPEDGSEPPNQYINAKGKVLRKYTLSDLLWKYLRAYAAKHKAAGNGFGFGLVGPDNIARTLSARYYKDGSEILISQGKRNPRRLTPRECARLMGFDRPGRTFKIPVSDTRAYKQFGNAVVVPVVEAIARHMAPYLRPALEETEDRAAIA